MRNPQEISIQYVKGVGPARKKMFERLGIENIEDLLYFFPRRYEDRRQMTPIVELKAGEWQTTSGKILSREGRRSWYTKKHVSQITVDDGQGRLECVWFNQPYLDKYLQHGEQIVVYGKVDIYKNKLQMVSPEYEVITSEDKALSTGRIVPIYPLTKGLTQRYLRKIILFCLERYAGGFLEILPYSLRKKYRLENIVKSIHNIHYPADDEAQTKALDRISFEEFFMFQVSVLLRRLSIVRKTGIAHKTNEELARSFIRSLPFELTGAQKRVIKEISLDMSKPAPMLRLLQGDVGCGKTLVAFWGCAVAFHNGLQAAVMAPTEILARQHFEVLSRMAQDGPFRSMKIAFLVSNLPKKEKETLHQRIKDGKIDLVVGTHALLQENVAFKNLSFVVIDEQHKFGVRQRALLSAKGTNPDVLIMTATPIPRTLCLTLYADLDLSVIDQMPPGRGKIQTRHFPEEKAAEAYAIVAERLKAGQQAYIIYPIIEESEALDLKAAAAMFKHFQKHEFKDFRVGLIHGQMGREESQTIMTRFKNHDLDVLVATSVVEVGVDVPTANVMVIEHADRFGLAQLHQLRGRIGRGGEDAVCLLISDMETPGGRARIEAVLSSNDGFKIAQQDLLIRGPGEFFGRHQHGLNELKVANPATQIHLLEQAREEALSLLKEDPKLEDHAHTVIRETIRKRYPTYLNMVEAG
jgi:ATP-dependent DNA helicase RecG